MPVRITAVLDLDTVTALLDDLTPFAIDLANHTDKDRWMHVDRPRSVELVAGVGLRLRTSARLQWTVAGLPIPFTIKTVTLMVGLELADTPQGGRLCVLPRIDEADLKHVPDVIDDKIVEAVNTRLAERAGAIGWTFGKTLALRLPLPPALAGLDRFEMDAQKARLSLGEHEIRLEAELPMRFTRVAMEGENLEGGGGMGATPTRTAP
jgi:hypothetical protein